jgi:hypothetical protein
MIRYTALYNSHRKTDTTNCFPKKPPQTLKTRHISRTTKNNTKQPIYTLNTPKNIRGRGGGKTGKAPHTNEKAFQQL